MIDDARSPNGIEGEVRFLLALFRDRGRCGHRVCMLLLLTNKNDTFTLFERLEIREDLEQQLVRNHRQRRTIIDQRSNHRHRRDCALDR